MAQKIVRAKILASRDHVSSKIDHYWGQCYQMNEVCCNAASPKSDTLNISYAHFSNAHKYFFL